MEQKHHQFKDHLLYVLVPLVIVIGFVSYQRFYINQDYVVSYEGECDPATQNCFMGCADDSCTEHYYYMRMQKYAPDLQAQCGEHITGCQSANVCLATDRSCNISFCSAENGSGICETISEDSASLGQDPKQNDI